MLTLLCTFRRLLQDFYQLLSPTVSVLRGGAYGELYTLDDFTTQEQLTDPRLWIDIKALMGDFSDNVPGLKVRSGPGVTVCQHAGKPGWWCCGTERPHNTTSQCHSRSLVCTASWTVTAANFGSRLLCAAGHRRKDRQAVGAELRHSRTNRAAAVSLVRGGAETGGQHTTDAVEPHTCMCTHTARGGCTLSGTLGHLQLALRAVNTTDACVAGRGRW